MCMNIYGVAQNNLLYCPSSDRQKNIDCQFQNDGKLDPLLILRKCSLSVFWIKQQQQTDASEYSELVYAPSPVITCVRNTLKQSIKEMGQRKIGLVVFCIATPW